MEGIYYIIVGLFFDIIGAIFIIRPLLDKIERPAGVEEESEDAEEEYEDEEEKKKEEKLYFTMNPFSNFRRNYQLAWIGLILLCFGFALQTVGNYIQSEI